MNKTLFTGREKIVSLRDLARTSKTDAATGVLRIIKGKEAIGYFIPEEEIELFQERMEVIENAAWQEWEELKQQKSKQDGMAFLRSLAA